MKRIVVIYSAIFLSLAFVSYTPAVQTLNEKCQQLTDPDVSEIESYEIGERKPLFVSAIQKVCEQTENGMLAPSTVDLVYASFLDNFRIDQGVRWWQIMGMGATHQLSPFFLHFAEEKSPDTLDVQNSFLWSPHNSFEDQSAA